MKTKTLTMFDKIAGIAALTFFLYITFLAVDAEGWKDGLLIILRILGTAMAATLVGVIVLSLIVWAVQVLEIGRDGSAFVQDGSNVGEYKLHEGGAYTYGDCETITGWC